MAEMDLYPYFNPQFTCELNLSPSLHTHTELWNAYSVYILGEMLISLSLESLSAFSMHSFLLGDGILPLRKKHIGALFFLSSDFIRFSESPHGDLV